MDREEIITFAITTARTIMRQHADRDPVVTAVEIARAIIESYDNGVVKGRSSKRASWNPIRKRD